MFEPEGFQEAIDRLEKRVVAHLPSGRLQLAVHDNRHTMISVKRSRGAYRARVHHMFLEAPPVIARALARYIATNEPESSRARGPFIDEHQHDIRGLRGKRARQQPCVVEGRHYHLQQLFDGLNHRYFQGKLEGVRISWGGHGGPARRRVSMKMGSYSVEERLIRMHPALDREFVPRFFVEWILFHEMLHHVHPIPVVRGRRQFHTREFLAHERTFHEYRRAREWERLNLDRLLTY
jgi:hypothetical protein